VAFTGHVPLFLHSPAAIAFGAVLILALASAP
jgi:hypothetical protein